MLKRTDRTKLKFLIALWVAVPFVAGFQTMAHQRAIRVTEQEQKQQAIQEEMEREALLSRMMEVAYAKR
jgi:hypothetical protein